MKDLLNRIKNILLRPREEWRTIHDEPAAVTRPLLRHASVLAAIPPLAAVLRRIILENGMSGRSSLPYVLATNAAWFAMNIVNILIAGAIVTAVIASRVTLADLVRGMKIAAYSFTPLFLAGPAVIIPGAGWAVYAAILYSLYLLYLGIAALSTVPTGRALWYTAVSFSSAGVIVAAVNLFEYLLESFVAEKLFFSR